MDRPLRKDADPQWQQLHAAADAQEPALTRLFYSLFVALSVRRVLTQMRAALRLGDVETAVQAVPVADIIAAAPAVEELLIRAAMGGATVASERTIILDGPTAIEAEIRVALGQGLELNTEAITNWARGHAAELVTDVSRETQRAIRDIITQAVHQSIPPARTARLIEGVIGLTRQQAAAVLRYSESLRVAGTPAAQLATLTQRYGARLLRHRARMIARTESLAAANMGRRLQWEREAREGLIARDRWHMEWVAIVPSDGRTCPICEELDGARAPIDGTFPDPGGAGPPAHPICRCTTRLVRAA